MSVSGNRTGKQSQVRIIGGQWRGRKLAFSPIDGLRPTGDRIKETVFNWLAPHIIGARCLDLFAGSGALGLEALSRGADHCDFVDSSSKATRQIEDHLRTLNALEKGRCHCVAAQQFLFTTTTPYDIVFLDPPFKLPLVTSACDTLVQQRLLQDDALVYVEMGIDESPPDIPTGWISHREKVAGGVIFRLYRVGTPEDRR